MFIGKQAFHGEEGELRFHKKVLSGDVDGDGRPDFKIKVLGLASANADDLILA